MNRIETAADILGRLRCPGGADPLRQYLRPHPALRPYIAHYTLYFPYESAEGTINIVPDASGCFVFTFGERGIDARVLGASTRMMTVPNSRTPPRLFVEFLPGGAHRLLDMPHHEMGDCALPLGQMDPTLARLIPDCAETADSARDLAAALDRLFLDRLERRPQRHPAVSALLWLQAGGIPTVKALSAETHYSERHLNRVVREHLGIGIKAYLRLLRVNRVLADLEAHRGRLTAYAAACGYFDQAHFIHDFRDICGVTPTEYLRNMSVYYNEPFKF